MFGRARVAPSAKANKLIQVKQKQVIKKPVHNKPEIKLDPVAKKEQQPQAWIPSPSFLALPSHDHAKKEYLPLSKAYLKLFENCLNRNLCFRCLTTKVNLYQPNLTDSPDATKIKIILCDDCSYEYYNFVIFLEYQYNARFYTHSWVNRCVIIPRSNQTTSAAKIFYCFKYNNKLMFRCGWDFKLFFGLSTDISPDKKILLDEPHGDVLTGLYQCSKNITYDDLLKYNPSLPKLELNSSFLEMNWDSGMLFFCENIISSSKNVL